jgi:restriction endonuclease S subunit
MSEALPEGWQNFKFGDIAENIAERVEPSETDLEIYVGLEHLDSESLKINRHGKPEDVKGTKLRVRPGDIIFGKRRAYQRKVAIADFDGICSAHAMVLRAKNENMAKDFFPFFMQSDTFMERALDISVGSLSPTINWKTLKVQKFPLPSLEEQKRMAEILWTLEEAIRKYEKLETIFQKARAKVFHELSRRGIGNQGLIDTPIGKIPKHWQVVQLGECLTKREEFSKPPHEEKRYVGLEHIESGSFSLINYTDSENVGSNCSVFYPGDLLYSKLRPYLDKAVIAEFKGIASTELLVLNANELTSNEYLLHHIHSKRFILHNTHHSYGTKMPRTSMKIIKKFKIPLPPIEEQEKILEIMQKFDKSGGNTFIQLKKLLNLKKRLLNDLLSGARHLGVR